MKKSKFSLLVNSSDGFEDCWSPFFTLLQRYWSELNEPIYLNTEKKAWEFENLEIKCTQAQKNNDQRLTWSECLQEALSQIDTEIVLYMQEDYFVEEKVDHDTIISLANFMLDHPEVKHIGLTHFGSQPPFNQYTDHKNLEIISNKSRYRISTQAGLWRKETLQSYVLPWESGWMFEIFGSIRSSRKKELFLTIKRKNTPPLIKYKHTGIIKGQWSFFVQELAKKENLRIDFTKRGFHIEPHPFMRRAKLFYQITSNPILAIKSILKN